MSPMFADEIEAAADYGFVWTCTDGVSQGGYKTPEETKTVDQYEWAKNNVDQPKPIEDDYRNVRTRRGVRTRRRHRTCAPVSRVGVDSRPHRQPRPSQSDDVTVRLFDTATEEMNRKRVRVEDIRRRRDRLKEC